ncbi:MAG: membrane protein insertase YidC [Candidatus Zixiibacteriota bacterium]
MDKKSIIIIGLCVILLLFWTKILEFVGLYKPAPPAPAQITQVDSTGSETETPLFIPEDETTTSTVDQTSAEPELADTTALDSTFIEKTFLVTTPLYELQFTNKGGGINKIVLRKFDYLDDRTGQVVLAESENKVVPDVYAGNNTFISGNHPFTTTETGFDLAAGSSPRSLTFTYTDPRGGRIVKTYTINPDAYDIGFEVSIEGIDQFGFERDYKLVWGISPRSTEKKQNDDYAEFKVVARMGGETSEYSDFDDGKMNEHVPSELTEWAGLRTKYFAAVMIPQNRNAAGVWATGYEKKEMVGGDEINRRFVTPTLDMPIPRSGTQVDSFMIYVGPIDYDGLDKYGLGLQEMTSLGWVIIKPFSIAIIWLLPKLYSVIPNYGAVVLVFALLIKLITFPLSRKQTAAMAKMKDLQPKMKQLQEKYKNDPQRLNKEMMKLYKEAGANPLSGCLPMLPQMPIFFALFTVFKTTIEFRGASFVGWITDLSAPDPYFILPIIMTLSMFVQQKMTMTDPKNKMLVYMMPLIFGYLFMNFPAGLVLYWTGFNILALAETLLVTKQQDEKNLQVKDA